MSEDSEAREKVIKEIRGRIEEEELPSVGTRKTIIKYSPRVYSAFFDRKYILPQFRVPHYYRQDFINFIEWANLAHFPMANPTDEIIRAAFVASAIALRHKRPQLFLEPELGDYLVRGVLPPDMVAQDIKWKWPGFKIFLPKNLLTIERDDFKHSLMYLDIAYMDAGGITVPKEFAVEFDRYFNHEFNDVKKFIANLEDFHFYYKEPAIVISGMIDKSPGNEGLTTYGLVKPFTQYTLQQVAELSGRLESQWERDALDDDLMSKMENLAFNILIFLSAYPLEFVPDEQSVLRKPRVKGDHHLAGLYPAKFVGQSQIRPVRGEKHHVASTGDIVGEHRYLKSHYRCGHWKRQPYGPKHSERKLIWVSLYKAGRDEEENNL